MIITMVYSVVLDLLYNKTTTMKLIKKLQDKEKGFYFENVKCDFFGIYYSYDNRYKDYWLNGNIVGYSINEHTHREFYI